MNPTRVTSCPEGPKADRHRRKENGKRLWDKAGTVKPGPGGHQAGRTGRTSRRDNSLRDPARLRHFTNTAEEKEQQRASVPSQTSGVQWECSLSPSCHRRPDGGPEKGTMRRAAPSRLPRGLVQPRPGGREGSPERGLGPSGAEPQGPRAHTPQDAFQTQAAASEGPTSEGELFVSFLFSKAVPAIKPESDS